MNGDVVERALEGLTHLIIHRSRTVVVVFLLVTALFAGGLGDIDSEEGTDAFAEGLPSQQTLDSVEEEFEPPFGDDDATTQLIYREGNVLTRGGLITLLEIQTDLEGEGFYRVEETSSVAGAVAQAIDPSATTPEAQLRVLEESTDAEVRAAVGTAAENPGFAASLSEDFSPAEPYASATIATAAHADGVDEREANERVEAALGDFDADVVAFGGGVFDAEFENVIEDSLAIVVPVVVVLILLFLTAAYRDPLDLVLGLVALFMAIVWTFGFTGHAGIAFSELMIAIPPLLLAVGIDFGIHAINRYREERVTGAGIEEGMTDASGQLLVAFFIVTGTTVIGFGANVTSGLDPVREFGFVASVGIVFTFLIFGLFLPAAKVILDRFRRRHDLPSFSTAPLGSEDSALGRLLPLGTHWGKRAPVAILLVVALVTTGAGAYATTVDTTFEEEDFLPPEEVPSYLEAAPGPLAPGEYTVTSTINYLEDNFASGEDDEVTVYAEGPIYENYALESIHRAGQNPPDSVVLEDGQASTESVVDVVHAEAERNPEFARLVEANDVSGNGVPDRNVAFVLESLLASDSRSEALRYVSEDLDSTRVIYAVEADAGQEVVTEDATELADDYRLEATATGDIVVFQEVSDLIFLSSLTSLAIALTATAVFLALIYHVLEGRASLGVANLVPIVVTLAVLGGTMAVLGVPLNALTGTSLSITIGVGVAYSVHVTHRFIDEYNACDDGYESLLITMRGTGGALTGSVLTTLGGAGSLVLAITPILGQFGLLMVISVIYSYLMAIVVLPPTLLVWERLAG